MGLSAENQIRVVVVVAMHNHRLPEWDIVRAYGGPTVDLQSFIGDLECVCNKLGWLGPSSCHCRVVGRVGLM
jgi:hypothetical protein